MNISLSSETLFNGDVQGLDANDNFAEKWLMDLIKVHGSKNVVVANPERVKKIVAHFFRKGKNSLHIVSDFDATLTKYWRSPGVKLVGGHNLLSQTNLVSSAFKTKLREAGEDFYEKEKMASDTKEKVKEMVDWYQKVHQIFVEEGLTEDKLSQITSQVQTVFREETHEFLENSASKNIPLMIYSAGVKEIIELLLSSEDILTSNISITANKMSFSTAPPHQLIGFSEPLVHVYNKGDIDLSLIDHIHYNLCIPRENLLLLGDSLGDIYMGERLPYKNILKIGFLNVETESLLPHYLTAFDIVILGDASISLANSLLENIS